MVTSRNQDCDFFEPKLIVISLNRNYLNYCTDTVSCLTSRASVFLTERLRCHYKLSGAAIALNRLTMPLGLSQYQW